jgi:hypothetical protein
MGKVIYLPIRDDETFVEPKNYGQDNETIAKLLLGIGGMLLLYGLCRLVRTIEDR